MLGDELQGQPRGLLVHGGLGELARLDVDVGAHDGIGVAVLAHDVIGAGIQPDDAPGRRIGDDDGALLGAVFLRRVDAEGDVAGREGLVLADHRHQAHPAGVEDQVAGKVAAGGDLAGRAGAAIGDVDEIGARAKHEADRAALGLANQLQLAVGLRRRIKDAPGEALGELRSLLGEVGREADGDRRRLHVDGHVGAAGLVDLRGAAALGPGIDWFVRAGSVHVVAAGIVAAAGILRHVAVIAGGGARGGRWGFGLGDAGIDGRGHEQPGAGQCRQCPQPGIARSSRQNAGRLF